MCVLLDMYEERGEARGIERDCSRRGAWSQRGFHKRFHRNREVTHYTNACGG